MPYAALLLIVPLITSLFNFGSTAVKAGSEGKLTKPFYLLLAGIGLYIFVKGYNKSKTQNYLDGAATDKPTQQAQGLHDAFNPVDFLPQSYNGTNVTDVMAIAAQITDYAAVSQAYRVLYSRELTTDLQDELTRDQYNQFFALVYKTSGTSATSSLVGKKVTATATVVLRDTTTPTKTVRQVTKGTVLGTYLSETDLTINNQKGRFVLVQDTTLVVISTRYYVLKASVSFS